VTPAAPSLRVLRGGHLERSRSLTSMSANPRRLELFAAMEPSGVALSTS
jgi:hypothetical protein